MIVYFRCLRTCAFSDRYVFQKYNIEPYSNSSLLFQYTLGLVPNSNDSFRAWGMAFLQFNTRLKG